MICRTTLNIVSVCLASDGQLSVYHRSGIPNNWYQSIWFKAVFDFCSKMKVVKFMFCPYHRVEEEETSTLVKTASKSNVRHGRTRRHAPTRWLSTRTDVPHASSSAGWADPTRIPDDPIQMTGPDKDDVIMTSAYKVGMSCQRLVS